MRLPQAMNGPNQHGAAEHSSSAVLRWWCFALTAQQVSGLELRQWKWETDAGSLAVRVQGPL